MVVYHFTGMAYCPSVEHPVPLLCWVQALISRSRKELEYSLTFRALYTNAANLVAIDRYQCVRVLQARFVSVISTDDSRSLLLFAALPRFVLPRVAF